MWNGNDFQGIHSATTAGSLVQVAGSRHVSWQKIVITIGP